MKIVAGLGSIDEYETFVKAGADEFFCGYVPFSWAEKYGVTISYLSAAVHSTTGFTFKSLLRRKRMEKAAALLSGTKLSVSDIIMAVGYENTSYFYRAFSEMYGVTPREYRLRQRG